ncbi:glutamine amidotransferase [Longimonas halophila]|uniref:Glutamine amidotransferase n=1 Tax=Longimonas halophila TaxID=1469170 RepID=A0A2H3NLZ1_9BACT|nr:type 1 glutamine amidotransferase [Longimonas halophila]PEN07070.1 glutamine amidotransferase [Longimonas halophila]
MNDSPSSSPLDSVKVLLLQARTSAQMERQERLCFLERARLRSDQLAALSVLRDPLPPRLLDRVDAVFIGGAGEYSAYDDFPWMPGLLDFVRHIADTQRPLFGSCWGHQVMARAFGGRVVHDSERSELGCRSVSLTESGASDPLFGTLPETFKANMGHHDRVTKLPDGAIELAHNEQPNQAFRMRDWPCYGTQFHSELDAERERERLIEYRDYYRDDLPSDKDFQAVLNNLTETPEVDDLLHRFLKMYAT